MHRSGGVGRRPRLPAAVVPDGIFHRYHVADSSKRTFRRHRFANDDAGAAAPEPSIINGGTAVSAGTV